MSNWEDFEIKCTEYLNKTFGTYANFHHKGGPDSTIPDIKVITKSGKSFYMEAKHSPAQCGQFVLYPDIATQTFIYSSLNSNKINFYAQKIIEQMNLQFYHFKEAGTKGQDIIMHNGSDIFSEWIIQTYTDKGVHFFITNDYTIVPVKSFKEYFHVTAKYRVKRSGSSSVGKNNIPLVSNFIKNSNYNIQNFRINNNKMFVSSNSNLHNQRFILNGYEYMFSLRDYEYEIRRLSNTFNANVIFSIELNTDKQGITPNAFIRSLI